LDIKVLAAPLGISNQSVYSKLNGTRPLRIEEVEKIAAFLRVAMSRLTCDAEHHPSASPLVEAVSPDVGLELFSLEPDPVSMSGYQEGRDSRLRPDSHRVSLERREDVLRHAKRGLVPKQIAEVTGLKVETVYKDLAWLRRRGELERKSISGQDIGSLEHEEKLVPDVRSMVKSLAVA
jgi:DNA-binding CsgD family transcriptional regulator